jgi:NAD(P)H-dependent flavin oxidoreductase YrpB (nitropropane dioxygenase family)
MISSDKILSPPSSKKYRRSTGLLPGSSPWFRGLQVAVSIPVIAAAGIADARGIVAPSALGAEGVQMGTAFLACEESGASALHRSAILGETFQSLPNRTEASSSTTKTIFRPFQRVN